MTVVSLFHAFYFDLMNGSCVFVSTGKWFQRYELGSWNCAGAATRMSTWKDTGIASCRIVDDRQARTAVYYSLINRLALYTCTGIL